MAASTRVANGIINADNGGRCTQLNVATSPLEFFYRTRTNHGCYNGNHEYATRG